MLRSGILNPHVLSLLARFRHTNTLVIADRGFPSWREIEMIDLSLVDDVPTVLQVVSAIRCVADVGKILMAEEFKAANSEPVKTAFAKACDGIPIAYEPHVKFKMRVPAAVGLIRTGDTIQYANLILESA